MPKIKLKHKSPEFVSNKNETVNKKCENPACHESAEFKAPKGRGINDYYWFCLEHVKEYNNNWNFFSGMNNDEIFSFMEKQRYGDRPTWTSNFTFNEENIRKESWDKFRSYDSSYGFKEEKEKREKNINYNQYAHSEEYEAMAIMGISPPITLDIIKKKYKELAKKYHPDRNLGCKESEEMLKTINKSYTTLKKAYEMYEKLPNDKK